MRKVFLGLLVIGLSIQSFAQVVNQEKLPEVEIYPQNSEYLNCIGCDDAAIIVDRIEKKVAKFDLKNSNFYVDENSIYNVSFYFSDGYIHATYNTDGEITNAIEKFNNSKLPIPVLRTVTNKYPGWSISKNSYKVSYNQNEGVTKTYRCTLENGGKRINIKTDGNGNFL